MKKILCFFLVFLMILSSGLSVFATNDTNPGEEKQAVSKIGESSFFSDKLPKCEDISPDKIPKYLKENAKTIGLPENGDFSYKKMTKDKLGIQHLRYTQTYNGIPVFGKEIIVDVKDGEVQSIQGMISTDTSLEKAVIGNTISKDKAKGIAQAYIDYKPAANKQYSQGNDSISTTASKCSDPELVWLDDNNTQILTYNINVSSIKPKLINKTLFIDASTGNIVKELENIKTEAVTGTGKGVLNDTKSVNLFLSNGRYYLRDVTLGDTSGATKTLLVYDFNTLDSSGNVYLMYDTNSKLCETNSEFLSQRAAVDSQAYFNQVFRYYRDVFDRNSYDDYGTNILTFIHYTPDGYPWANAAWTGNNAGYFVIGDGDGYPGYQDEVREFSAALDVLGHEFTHAVIDNGGGELIYENQSGAVNESLADVFGQIIERKYKRDTNWTLGEDMSIGSSDTYLRSLSNPALYGQPDHMSEYVTTTQDNGGVHINSGITNKAAYLIASQIGDDKTAQIYYYAMTNKLTASSDFLALRRAVISSAVALYPGTSYGGVVANAFDQVGITDAISITSIKTDLASPQKPGTKIRWTTTISGGSSPVYYYKIYKGSTVVAQSSAYSKNNYFDWTPTATGTDYRALVYVKEDGAANATSVSKYSSYYTITAPLSIKSISPSKPSPQLTNTAIRWTCSITGGMKPVYYFRVYKGTTLVKNSAAYSATNYFDWTPTEAGTDYRVLVNVKENGAANSTSVYMYSSYYTISKPVPIVIKSLLPNKASPQLTNTTIRWTCSITGGVRPVYYFRVYKGTTLVKNSAAYSATNYFDWTPTAAGTDYKVLVNVKEDGFDNSTSVSLYSGYYTVTAPIVISSLVPDKASPQPTGTKIRWTANITGGNKPVYYFKILKGSTVVSSSTAYTTTKYFDWTPTVAGTDYRALVYVREPGSASSAIVTKYSSYFTVTAPTAPIVIASLAPNKTSPQPTGATIRWTCNITGGAHPVYYFRVYKGSTLVKNSPAYSVTNYFDWTPTEAGTDYRVLVNVKEDGAANSTSVSRYSSYYSIVTPTPIVIKSVVPDKTSPQQTNTAIRWTCNITGGVKPVYYFRVYKGTTLVKNSAAYSTANYFDWTPTVAGTDYRILVNVKEDGAANSTSAAMYSAYYTVTAPAPKVIETPVPEETDPGLGSININDIPLLVK